MSRSGACWAYRQRGGETDDTQTDRAAVPRYTGDKVAGVLCLAPRQRCPVGENFPLSLIQV